MDFFQPIDHGTTYLFDWLAQTRRELYPLFAAGSWLSSWLVAGLVTLLAAWLLARKGDRRRGGLVLAAFVAAQVAVEAVRLLVNRDPPNFGLKWLEDGAAQDSLYLSTSFPSPSILLSTAAWVFLILTTRALTGRKRDWLLVSVLAAIVVFGGFVCNLALGRHYLSDLLASLCGGIGVAFVAWSWPERKTAEATAFADAAR